MSRSMIATGVLALLLAGCSADSGGSTVTVTLGELNDSGITGTATLTATNGTTMVEVSLTNAGTGPQPIHVHPGTCADLDAAPAYPLSNVENGTSSTEIEADLVTLREGEFAINAHKSVEEAQIYVACGDIT